MIQDSSISDFLRLKPLVASAGFEPRETERQSGKNAALNYTHPTEAAAGEGEKG